MYTLRSMDKLSRRAVLKGALSGVALGSVPSMALSEQTVPVQRKGRIKQSASRWCYGKTMSLDDLCQAAPAHLGLKGIDLVPSTDLYGPPPCKSTGWCLLDDISPRRRTVPEDGLNRTENHAAPRTRVSRKHCASDQGGERAQRDYVFRQSPRTGRTPRALGKLCDRTQSREKNRRGRRHRRFVLSCSTARWITRIISATTRPGA